MTEMFVDIYKLCVFLFFIIGAPSPYIENDVIFIAQN